MIIDPLSYMTVDADRRLEDFRSRRGPAPERRSPRRGVLLRVATWATGRAVHA